MRRSEGHECTKLPNQQAVANKEAVQSKDLLFAESGFRVRIERTGAKKNAAQNGTKADENENPVF
jgi:hypothetical protein